MPASGQLRAPARIAPNPGWYPSLLATAMLATGLLLVAVSQAPLEPLSRHMAGHIVLMNVGAPALALGLNARSIVRGTGSGGLACATVLQLVLLWGWHAPAALFHAHGYPGTHVLAQVTVLGAALWFWIAVFAQIEASRWRAIIALLFTGKLFCLLAALLTFSPRPLYGAQTGAHAAGHSAAITLADQQLAGLMMLAACPATYVLAGVVIAARWLDELSRMEG